MQIKSYLTNLNQNRNLNDTILKEDIDDKKKIFLIKTPDYFTFMRIEHEINELIRKHNEFHEIKAKYFEEKEDKIPPVEHLELNKSELNKSEENLKEKETGEYKLWYDKAKDHFKTNTKKERNVINIRDKFLEFNLKR